MYQKTLALSDNPFRPDLISGRPDLLSDQQDVSDLQYLTDLDRSPLRVDKCPKLLLPLFCQSVLNLGEHMTGFREFMEDRGYQFDGPPRRGTGSALVVVRGAQGVGKTTFASWMMAELMQLPGVRPWKAFELPPARVAFCDWTEAAFETAASQLQSNIAGGSQAGDHIAVLLEDVTKATWNRAVGLLEQFRDRFRFSIVTTHDLELLDQDPRSLSGGVHIKVFTLPPVRQKDAETYVRSRIERFRDPNRPEINALSPIFPFTPESIQGLMKDCGPEGAASTVTLRVLNTQLQSRIDALRRAVRRKGLGDIGVAAADSLTQYLLELAANAGP